jgi:S1-C subfamily serine protease
MNIRELSGFQLAVLIMLVLLLCGVLGLAGAILLSAGGFFAPQAEEPLAQVKAGTPSPPAATPTATLPPTFTPSPTGTPTTVPPTNTLVPIPPTETYTPVPPTNTPGPASSGSQGIQQALLAAVQLLVPEEGSSRVAQGTGSVVDQRGYILTNFHVIGDENGRLYNSQGLIYVAVNPPGLNAPPETRYLAELVEGDTGLDLALLRITADKDGAPLSGPINLRAVAIGDSSQVRIGDSLTIIGFPALGLDTVTLTRGTVAGFLADGHFEQGWIKTDAEINPGNSGGLAVNEAGQLVAVPSVAISGEQVSGKIGYLRPINLARTLLSKIQ